MTEVGEGAAVRGPWWWERRRSAVLDVVLALASAVECAWTGVDFADEAGLPAAAGVVLGLVAGSVLVLRRRWPIAVVLVSIALSPAEMGVLLGFVGLYSLAVAPDMPRRITVSLTAMQAAAAVVVAAVRMHQSIGQEENFDPPAWFIPSMSVTLAVVLTAPPVLMGLYVRARRRLVESLRERADGLERELALLADRAEERAEWARSEERTRIAREMHDVVAHRVSLMVVHAAALQAVALKDPEKASKNAALVGDMGRQALTELRTMLGVLRSPDRSGSGSGPVKGSGSGETTSGGVSVRLAEFAVAATASGGAGGSAGAADGADAVGAASATGAGREVADGGEVAGGGPSLADLEDLVGQSRAAGMSVEFSADEPGDPDGTDGSDGAAGPEVRSYGARVERTAYRVVQEALTNVHKHAPGARTRVRLARRAGEVAVQVENGRPDEGAAEGAVACPGLPSGGNGLVGMAERVNALGGGFVSGATDEGGFRVSAVIPAQRAEDGGKA